MTTRISFALLAPISALRPRPRTWQSTPGSLSNCGKFNPCQNYRTTSLTIESIESPLKGSTRQVRAVKQDLPAIPFLCSISDLISVNTCQVKSIIVVFVADILADTVALDIFARIHEPNDILRVALGLLSAYTTVDLISAIFNLVKAKRTFRSASIQKLSFPRLVAPNCLITIPSFLMLIALPARDILMDSFLCYLLSFFALLPAIAKWNITERMFEIALRIRNRDIITRHLCNRSAQPRKK